MLGIVLLNVAQVVLPRAEALIGLLCGMDSEQWVGGPWMVSSLMPERNCSVPLRRWNTLCCA